MSNKTEQKKETYNIAEREKHWREFWEKERIYQFKENSPKPFYVVDTPPPYVSAEHLHVGHIMSYSQAEFIVRFKRMTGFEVFYPMGFDDNGLPTERFVEKKYNIQKQNITREEFVKKCLKETKIGSLAYKNLWQGLGISVDWTKTYSTIDSLSQQLSQWSFIDLFKKGKIYRAKKPIMWCTTCRTAISQADLEDQEKETDLVFIEVKIKEGETLVFATTRPELLPSCVGMSVHLLDARYKKFIGKKVIMPITGVEIEITTDEMIDPAFGTGLVYFCSSGDRQFLDWEVRHPIKNKISLIMPDGRMGEAAGKYRGLTVSEARQKIVQDLSNLGVLKKQEKITHTVNTHERCSTDIEYIESLQWFVDVLSIKEQLLKQGDKMRWHPRSMKQKYIDWVKGLKWDWCISRQRYYGVPFPVWYCKKCGNIVLAKEKELPVEPTLHQPKIKSCSECAAKDFVPEKDVMDTWMTSSLTALIGAHLVKQKGVQQRLYPANLRPQGFEIIRTWLFYTIVKSFYHHQKVPFYDIMISGHGLDSQGRKISKRLGNYIPAEQIIEKYGADSLRYWATGATLGSNLRYSEDEVKKGKRTVIKLFNAANFCFQHFKGVKFATQLFNPLNGKNYSRLCPVIKLTSADKWLLHNLNGTIKKATEHFESFKYSKAKDIIDDFFWKVFCDNYLEFVKHRLYQKTSLPTVVAAKAVLYQGLLALIKMYAPLLPYITEEIYQRYFRQFEKAKSVHLLSWPESLKSIRVEKRELKDFEKVVKVIQGIRADKARRQISLAEEIDVHKTRIAFPEKYSDFIKQVGRVKKIIVL